MCVIFLGRQYQKVIIQPVGVDRKKDLEFDDNDIDLKEAEITMDDTMTFLHINGITFSHPRADDTPMLAIFPLASIQSILVSVDELKKDNAFFEAHEIMSGGKREDGFPE